MTSYLPIARELEVLIQQSIEHGFTTFYQRMETFYNSLTRKSPNIDQSLPIEMENIKIYIHIFAGAQCLNIAVFLGEIAVSHRKKIAKLIADAISFCRKEIGISWRRAVLILRSLFMACRRTVAFCWGAMALKLRMVYPTIRKAFAFYGSPIRAIFQKSLRVILRKRGARDQPRDA